MTHERSTADEQFAAVFGLRRGHRHRGITKTAPLWTGSADQEKYFMSQFGQNWPDVRDFLEGLSEEVLTQVSLAHLSPYPQLRESAVPHRLPFWAETLPFSSHDLDPLYSRVCDAALRTERTKPMAAAAASVASHCVGFNHTSSEDLSFAQMAACHNAACAIVLQDALSAPVREIMWEPYQVATGKKPPWQG